MKLVKHRNLESLLKQAEQDKQEIFETPISISYRIFNKQGNTIRMNIFYK